MPGTMSCSTIDTLGVYWSVLTSVTKYHRLDGFNQQNLFTHSSGGKKSKIKWSAWLVSSEAPLLALCSHTFLCFSLCPNFFSM